ncbi:condensation domain-containing protein [Streptomyces sp. NBC_01207]|uniref:condensation domain-containing protein n=1 Tax=Streptomyces sp. NBC_01207 TaxID=2903772 RepID=UPI002E0D5BD9|nr:condensation domain-containing protein [Streptomyces sp. NBC_01207]
MENDIMHHQGQEAVPLTLPQLLIHRTLRDGMDSGPTLELSYRIEGPLDVPAFIASIGDVVGSHDALRLAICDCGDSGPHQWARATPPLAELVTCQQIKAGSEERLSRFAAALATKDVSDPWDLRTEFPFRLRLLQHSPDLHAFTATFSQLAVDGSVRAVFGGDLWQAYRRRMGDHEAVAEPGPQFLDVAAEREALAANSRDVADFWRHRYARIPRDWGFLASSVPHTPDTPDTAPDTPDTPDTAEAGSVETGFVLEGERLRAMRQAARSNNATEFIWIQHALVSAVFEHTDADSIPVWLPVDTRSMRERRLLGMLTLGLPMVVDRGAAPSDLVRTLSGDWFDTLRHRRVTRETVDASGVADLGDLVAGPDRSVRFAYVSHPRHRLTNTVGDLVVKYGAYAPQVERVVSGVQLKAGSWDDSVHFRFLCNRSRLTETAARQMTAAIERTLLG